MSIEQQGMQMSQLKELGDPDLQMSVQVRDGYVDLIGAYRDALAAQRDKVMELADWGLVGGLKSAQQIRNELIRDVTGDEGVHTLLDRCLVYLNDFEEAVVAVFDKVIAEDQAS